MKKEDPHFVVNPLRFMAYTAGLTNKPAIPTVFVSEPLCYAKTRCKRISLSCQEGVYVTSLT